MDSYPWLKIDVQVKEPFCMVAELSFLIRATTDDLNKLHAMMMTKADEQDRKINVLQDNLDRAKAQIKLLEFEKKQAKLDHTHFGKDLWPDGFDGKSAEASMARKLKVVNYFSAWTITITSRKSSSGPAS